MISLSGPVSYDIIGFNDNGVDGDRVAGDGLYAKTVASPSQAGTYILTASAFTTEGSFTHDIRSQRIQIVVSDVPVNAPASDFNGDGKADLVWSNTANGDRYLWLMNGGAVSESRFLGNVGVQWSPTPGDFNGDGKADLVWSNTANGDRYLWLMNGGAVSESVYLGNISTTWSIDSIDANGDGKADIVWSSSSNGDRYLWLMDGDNVTSDHYLGRVATQWKIAK